MPFPISYRYCYRQKTSLSNSELTARVEEELLRQKASGIRTEGGVTSFQVDFFRFASNWNLFTSVNSGQLSRRAVPGGVELELEVSFTRMLAIVTLMVFGFMGSFVFLAFRGNVFQELGILCLGWSWLFGMNYLTSVLRLRSWVRALLASDSRGAKSVPWWKFAEGAGQKIGDPLTEFQPKWQPAWLQKIRWRWKMPLLVWTVVILWNALLFPFASPGMREVSHRLGFAVQMIWAVTGLLFIFAPYWIGLGIEKWNEQVRAKSSKR